MTIPTLEGPRIRLEPLSHVHLPGLEQVIYDPKIWRYMLNRMETREDLDRWLEAALALAAKGTAMPWVTILKQPDGDQVIGSTRFLDLDRTHQTVEIGHTWLHGPAQGTGLNTEVKLLQLTHAFEVMGLRRVAFKTHHENLRSQAAIRKLGAIEEGTFRNHYILPDGSQRHSVWFSITREEWPMVKERLTDRLG